MKREYTAATSDDEETNNNNNTHNDDDELDEEESSSNYAMPLTSTSNTTSFSSSSSSYPLDLTLKSKHVMLAVGGENANPKKLRKIDHHHHNYSSDNENETTTTNTSSSLSTAAAVAAAAAVEQIRRAQYQAAAAALAQQQQQHHHQNRPSLSSIDQLKLLSSSSSSQQLQLSTTPQTLTPAYTPSTPVSSASKQPKCVLPPVSQEQFDKYSNINTDELVKRVKDLLSKYSISQRLFGECILGLSQGSVSDLLARPKHWVMLTQKGREPFIRMQMFIDDPDSIKKLMANQYKAGGAGSGGSTTPSMITNSPVTPSDKTAVIHQSTTSRTGLLSQLNHGGLLQIDSKGTSFFFFFTYIISKRRHLDDKGIVCLYR